MHDWQLLREYTTRNSQEAFAELVRRHINMVYSTCLREVGERQLAEDVTQVVFVILASKAHSLQHEGSLAGWLFQTARFASKNVLRQEQNRRQKEQRIAEEITWQMQTSQKQFENEENLWQEIEPGLHEALDSLKPSEREAVVLRFFAQKSLRETGDELGISEDAARMRVTRALQKLRDFFARRGLVLSTTLLALLLEGRAVQAAPASLLATVETTLHQGALCGQPLLYWGDVTKAMLINKIQTAALASVALIGAVTVGSLMLHAAPGNSVLPKATASFRTVSLPLINKTPKPTARLRLHTVSKEEVKLMPPRFVRAPVAAPLPGESKPPVQPETEKKTPAKSPVPPINSLALDVDPAEPKSAPKSAPTEPKTPIASLQLEAQPGHNRPVLTVAYSPDGALVATGSRDQTIRLWSTRSGECLQTLFGHKAGVSEVIFAPDGKALASASGVNSSTHFDNTIKVWNVQSGQIKHSLVAANTTSITALAISPDGKTIAGGSRDKSIHLWNLQDGTPIGTWTAHRAPVTALAFSPDGSLLASGGGYGDNSVKLWNPQDGQLKSELGRHGAMVGDLAFSPEGNLLASGGHETVTKVWDLASGKVRFNLPQHLKGFNETVMSVAFSPDGEVLATLGDRGEIGALLWDVTTGQMVSSVENVTSALDFSPDGSEVAFGRGNSICLHDAMKNEDRLVLRGSSPLRTLAIAPSGNMAVTGDEDGIIRLWDLKQGQMKRAWAAHQKRVLALAFSEEGTLLASGGKDGNVNLWDAATGTNKWKRMAHDTGVFAVGFVEGDLVVSGGHGNAVKLWSRNTGRPPALPNGDTLSLSTEGETSTLVISRPQGNMEPLLATGSGKDVIVRDLQELKTLFTLRGHSQTVVDMAFFDDGKKLVSVGYDKTARLWDILTGQPISRLVELDRPFHCVAVAPNGLVALGYDDLRIVNAETGKATLLSLRERHYRDNGLAELGRFWTLAFSPDGKILYSGGEDGALRAWGMTSLGGVRPLAEMWPLLGDKEVANSGNLNITSAYAVVTAQGYYAASPDSQNQLRWRRDGKLVAPSQAKALALPDMVQKALSGVIVPSPTR